MSPSKVATIIESSECVLLMDKFRTLKEIQSKVNDKLSKFGVYMYVDASSSDSLFEACKQKLEYV